MCVANNQNDAGQLKETCLPFEGLLEALCRLAALKALPTDAEIAVSARTHGHEVDAGAYMFKLQATDSHGYQRLLKERAGRWGSVQVLQPFERCVNHLLAIVIRRIDDRPGKLELSKTAFSRWAAQNMRSAGTR